jgi:hypothetical protein
VFHQAGHFLFTGRTQEKNPQPDRGGNRDPAAVKASFESRSSSHTLRNGAQVPIRMNDPD